jgi:hypothetical protein
LRFSLSLSLFTRRSEVAGLFIPSAKARQSRISRKVWGQHGVADAI